MIFNRSVSLLAIFYILLYVPHISEAQSFQLNDHPNWLIPADTLHQPRFIFLSSSVITVYGITLYGLDKLWYADYPKGKFRWADDSKEWLQVDKAGHMVTSYLEAYYLTQILRWSGVEQKKAAIYGGLTAFIFQNTIEVFDGFSELWGASVSDIAANFLGAALMTTQELVWEEQRIKLKLLPVFTHFSDPELRTRSEQLYGKSLLQRSLKDYNSIHVWMSINPASFTGKDGKFSWLNIAIGYGAGGMFGGYDNIWTDADGIIHDRTDIERYRKFMLSLDVDLSRVKTKSRYLRQVLDLVNIIKVPFPTIEWNTKGELRVHPLY